MRRRQLLPPLDDGDHEDALINLTPLIDVVFVLLITFMLLAPLLNVDHVELAKSGILSQTDLKNGPFAITLRSDNSILFQGKFVNFEQLKAAIHEQKLRFPGEFPQLIADKSCHFGLYQDVKNLLEECGFQQMDVLLQ
jgi:biopolymer transport protein ExbD